MLVGLSGTGKSTVAPLLADRWGRRCVDVDRVVEASAGLAVAELFAERGEAAFRSLEADELARALAGPPSVVATGGGAVLDPASRSALAGHAVVWLRCSVEELVRRLRAGEERPLLVDDPATTLQRLAAERDPLYGEVADVVVDVGGRDPAAVADAVAAELDGTVGADDREAEHHDRP